MINETSNKFYDSLNIFPNNVKKIQFWSILCSIKWAKLGRSHGGSRAMTGSQERTVWRSQLVSRRFPSNVWWGDQNRTYVNIMIESYPRFLKNIFFLPCCEFIFLRDVIGSKNCGNGDLARRLARLGRVMVVRQEVWAITLILGEEREKCSVHTVDRGQAAISSKSGNSSL